MKNIYLTIVLLCFSFQLFAQEGFQFTSNAEKVKVPFKLLNNLIFIPVSVNGVSMTFLVDTGVEETILFSLEETDTVPFFNVSKVKLRGLGSEESIETLSSTQNKLVISKKLMDADHTILIILDQEINLSSSIGITVNGIIGYHLFKNKLVTINYQKQELVIYDNAEKNPSKKFRKYESVPITVENNKPYVFGDFKFNGTNQHNGKLLVDTGNTDALWLFENQSEQIKVPKENFEDYLGRGFSGEIHGKRGKIQEFALQKFSFKNPYAAFPDSVSIQNVKMVESRVGSVGGELLKRFTVVFDYTHEKMYLKKNENFSKPFSFNMSGLEINHVGVQWVPETTKLQTFVVNTSKDAYNVNQESDIKYNFVLKPIFKIVNVRKDSPAAIAGLQKDDLIVSINNKLAAYYTLQEINDLLKSEEGRKIIFELNRKGVIVKRTLTLKNIL